MLTINSCRLPCRRKFATRAFAASCGSCAKRAAAILTSLFVVVAVLSGCTKSRSWHETDISGAMPDLQFTMMRAKDNKTVTAADYRGKVTLLYFGYTYCPDICPTTLANVAAIIKGLGGLADHVRVLFVTVDPNRDTPKVLNQYTDAFAPQVDGLRGTADQLASLARRYRVAYSVTPSPDPSKYEVTHSPAVYVFDGNGKVRLLMSSLGTTSPDVKGATADLKRLAEQQDNSGPLAWLWNLI
jgi:protein SCO1